MLSLLDTRMALSTMRKSDNLGTILFQMIYSSAILTFRTSLLHVQMYH